MQVMQLRPVQPLRRWCRSCGLPGPANQPGCAHCQTPTRAVRDVSATFNSGENVQHNVVNIESIGHLGDIRESLDELRNVDEYERRPARPSFLRQVGTFACAFVLGVLLVFGLLVILICGLLYACH